jgi:hypothetical protein
MDGKALYEHKFEWVRHCTCTVFSKCGVATDDPRLPHFQMRGAQAASASLERPVDVGPTLRACTM